MAKTKAPDDRHAERLRSQRKALAAEYGLPIDDHRIRRLALLEAAHQAAEDQLADGRAVDIGDVLALDKAIADQRAALKAQEPITIDVNIIGRCPDCGAEYERKKLALPPALPPAPPAIEATPTAFARPIDIDEAPTARAEPVFARPIDEAPKPKPAVKPAPPPHSNSSVSSFHNQAGVPLKRLQPGIHDTVNVSPMSKR